MKYKIEVTIESDFRPHNWILDAIEENLTEDHEYIDDYKIQMIEED